MNDIFEERFDPRANPLDARTRHATGRADRRCSWRDVTTHSSRLVVFGQRRAFSNTSRS